MKIETVLNLLAKIDTVTARLPEFKKLFDEMVGAFDRDADQTTLKHAYELAIKDARDAHERLQELVAQYN